MRQLRTFLLVLAIFFVASSVPAQVAHRARPGQLAAVLKVSAARRYIREATGRNDGPDVEATQRAAGARKGAPWCGCEQFMEQKLAGLPSPPWPAAARTWSLASSPRTYFIRGLRGSLDSLRPGHQVTFYYANLGRVGHVGRLIEATRPVRRGRPVRGWVVRAGNTGTGGGRDGAGVHDVWYPSYEVYAANWLY